jgi:hypothetical protein
MTALDQAIEIGERAVAEAIAYREIIRRASDLLRSGRPDEALRVLETAAFIARRFS